MLKAFEYLNMIIQILKAFIKFKSIYELLKEQNKKTTNYQKAKASKYLFENKVF